MDNSPIRGRFRLSTTNLTSPIAESTCLDGLSSRTKFNWGEGTISPKSRNSSTAHLEKNNSTSKNVNAIPAKVSMSLSSRIDPRTYVDIHSNGLASRIVKYHDKSTRINRSLSVTNLYYKPGQFPVVHLKKSDQQYKAKKTKNLSMTRVAAPEKSAFYGNTLSSILRSGSIVGLQKSDEETSRENRPILHPPPTENEMAPTRSVLEVLKEISRKRINSDEINGIELNKKQCKRSEQGHMTNINQGTQIKRQREINKSTTSNAQISPEQQVIKKRMCNYNNDILSSLSSSMTSVNKNKMIKIQSPKRSTSDLKALSSSNTCRPDFEPLRSEKQRCMGTIDLQHFTASTKYSPTSPLPRTQHQSVNELNGVKRNEIVSRRASESVLSNKKPKLTLFNKDYDEIPTDEKNDTTERRGDGDLCGIQFVKPKKSNSMSSSRSLLMAKTKKSKLALMLSGLKGELHEEYEIDTEISNEKHKRPFEETVRISTSLSANITRSSSLLPKITTVTTLKANEATKTVSRDSAIRPTEVIKDLNFTPNAVNTDSSNSEFQIKTGLVIDTTPPTSIAVPAVTKSAPISAITVPSVPKRAAVGFSFGLSTPNKDTPTTTTALTPHSSTAPKTSTSVSSETIPVKATVLTGYTKPFPFDFTLSAATTSSQSLSSTKELSLAIAFATTTTKTTEPTPPVFVQSSTSAQPTFSFGSLAGRNTTANALTTASPNFGLQKNTYNSQTTTASTNSSSCIVGISSFRGGVSSTQSTSSLTSTTSTGGLLFGASSSTEASKALFGSMNPVNKTSTNSNTFSVNKAPKNPMTQANAFTFRSGSVTSPASPVNTAITVCTTTDKPLALALGFENPQNLFANKAPIQPPNKFSFGFSGATPQKGEFSFSSDKNTVAVPTAGSSVGGFSVENLSANSLPVADASKDIFGTATPETKPAFSFSSSATTIQTPDKPMFGVPANIFGTSAMSSNSQASAFTFGSSTSKTTNKGTTASIGNLFGSEPTHNIKIGLIASTSSNSVFGAPSAAVAPVHQSSTLTFGTKSSNTKQNTANPAGGLVFGSIASKPAVDINKTFVFGDSNTTIKLVPSSTTNLFGGNNAANGSSSIAGATDNKMFSFKEPAVASNNAFAANRQTVNSAPAFNFGSVAPAATTAPLQNGYLFAPQGQPPTDRPIRKAMRRLHRT